MSLNGKCALVTGAAQGLGQAMAVALAQAGASVAIADIRYDALNETAEKVRAAGGKVVQLEVNVLEYEQVRNMVQKAASELGSIDIAVNNAGVLGLYKVSEMSPEEWDRVMNINSRGVFYCCKAELEVMQPRKFGRIINTASIAGKVGLPDMSHYSASKFAVIGFTNSLAKEVAREGITVNAICPGIVGTGMWRGPQGVAQRWANAGETEEQAWERLQSSLLPQGVAQTPEDIAQMVVFLANAPHITGQAIAIDGGFSL